MSTTTKYRRRTLSIECQFDRLQTQWKNGQSGAGAWFWQHFKPILLTVHESNKELHLQCLHCSKLFSARNPSRTSLEHLKSGACNVFRRTAAYEQVKSTARPCSSGKKGRGKGVKRSEVAPVEDFGRKRTSNEIADGAGISTEARASATKALSHFFLESGIPATLLSHPRLQEFCNCLGIIPPIPEQLLTTILHSRFSKIRQENEIRMRKTGVYQIAAEGWRSGRVTISINFQEGPPAFLKSIHLPDPTTSDILEIMASVTEEVDAIMDRRNCIGWITDLRSKDRQSWVAAEERYPWMINTVCQAYAIRSLLKDLAKHVKVVQDMIEDTQRIVTYFHSHLVDLAALRRKEPALLLNDLKTMHSIVAKIMTLESVWRHRSTIEGSFVEQEQLLSQESDAIATICLNRRFWNRLEAVHELIRPILATHQEVEQTQPHFSQALDMWLNLARFFEEWRQSHVELAEGVTDVFVKRFNKTYHPAMSAAYLLDPGFCVKYDEKSYQPNWDRLHAAQQTDAQLVLKKVSAPNRGGRVVSDFGRWRSQGLPAEFGNVVSERALLGANCLSKCVPMALRKTTWTSCLKEFEALGIVAHRLLSMRATATGLRSESMQTCADMTTETAQIVQSLEYVQKNARLAQHRLVDEKHLDADLIALLAAYPEDTAVASAFDKQDEMSLCPEVTQEGELEEASQLYMHQLQLGTSPHVSQSLLRLSPPPLGTIPELPLPESTDIAISTTVTTPIEGKKETLTSNAAEAETAGERLSTDLDPTVTTPLPKNSNRAV